MALCQYFSLLRNLEDTLTSNLETRVAANHGSPATMHRMSRKSGLEEQRRGAETEAASHVWRRLICSEIPRHKIYTVRNFTTDNDVVHVNDDVRRLN